MAEDKVSYGWTGKIARVNLTTGAVSVESTEPYKFLVGGMGLANKIMYDEVPAGTDPFSPESKIVYAVGPLTASGIPLGGRMTCASLSTFTKDHLVVDSHCGGMLGPRIKFAGWDAIIVEGASDTPVFIHVKDDQITIEDATAAWGQGTRATTEILTQLTSDEACVGAIGPAGENLLPYACMINSRNHSAGAGLGAVMGSKKLKALVVEGNGSVYVKDPQKVGELSDYMLSEVIGSNNNHVVPCTQQEWAEYYDKGSRWTAEKGLEWGAAEGGPIDTGEPKPYELNTVGYRCMKAKKDNGVEAAKYTIKMDGCFSCPIHCYSDLRIPAVKDNTGYEICGNTCVPDFPFYYMEKMLGVTPGADGNMSNEDVIVWNLTIGNVVDDLGLWCNYAQLYRDLAHCIADGVFERVLPKEEYDKYNWDGFKEGSFDPTAIVPILRDIAKNDSELSYIGHGPLVWCERWDDEEWFDDSRSQLINYRGWPVHHAHECFGQVGAVYNMMFNRDDMIHSAVNFQGCGLPFDLKRQIAAEVWGQDDAKGEYAIDPTKNYTPMNQYKANFCWWSIVTDVLHDSLVICNWVWPMTMSPTKQRNYRGDLDLEAKFYNAVTGENVTTDQLYKAGAAIMTLQRANTVRGMGSYDLRNEHDKYTEWAFNADPDIPPFNEGTIKMDHDDFQNALTMVYEKFNWNKKYGCPTRACLEDYGLSDVADELDSLGLLPDPDDDEFDLIDVTVTKVEDTDGETSGSSAADASSSAKAASGTKDTSGATSSASAANDGEAKAGSASSSADADSSASSSDKSKSSAA
ncbi:MAG: aldehyde ferredoxin oxidoreductase [Coriobacteriales bacterium]|jgi:aldehyde:ferredoxin oxidoreductase